MEIKDRTICPICQAANNWSGEKIGHIVQPGYLMSATQTPASFNAAFRARVRALRESRGLTQGEMASALGVEEAAYRKYETRSPLPQHLIERFAVIVGASVEFVVTGRGSRRQSPPTVEPGGGGDEARVRPAVEIRKVARRMIRTYGDRAVAEALSRAASFEAAGDTLAARPWRRIAATARRLIRGADTAGEKEGMPPEVGAPEAAPGHR